MLITTVLTFFVIRYAWNYPLMLCIAATGVFFVVDLAFFTSNMVKLVDGGWFPLLLIAGGVYALMLTWKDGRRLLKQKLKADAIDLNSFWKPFCQPTSASGGHCRVFDRGNGHRAERHVAQPQTQQGVA